ncbi:MAG TPA: SDR family NAD(P)-dependent oxidoreductase [Acidimicrobiales bacterium]|nr:SDR family NAD(P)-dependent oxidoreductase [Acidimicrobiales bacterium]
MQELRDKVAVVTGGASGIGLAVARRAAAEGMRLVLADIDEPGLKVAVDELASGGTSVLGVPTDVSDPGAVEALAAQTVSNFGAVHVVHNNAGVGIGGPMWEVTDTDWKWVLGVNLFGVVNGIRAFVPRFIEQGEGHVVNTASLAGLVSAPLMGPYNASKHAVVTISETLAKDLRMFGATGVGVSVLCPGFVKTGIAESERSRPQWAPPPEESPVTEMLRATFHNLVDNGIDAEPVAEAVIEAVKTNRFYILTHDESQAAVAVRMRDILEGRTPSDTAIP